MQLFNGMIVHYAIDGRHRAAVITEIHGNGTVDLYIFGNDADAGMVEPDVRVPGMVGQFRTYRRQGIAQDKPANGLMQEPAEDHWHTIGSKAGCYKLL